MRKGTTKNKQTKNKTNNNILREELETEKGGRLEGRREIQKSRTGNTCVRAAQRPETGSSAQDLSTLPTGV